MWVENGNKSLCNLLFVEYAINNQICYFPFIILNSNNVSEILISQELFDNREYFNYFVKRVNTKEYSEYNEELYRTSRIYVEPDAVDVYKKPDDIKNVQDYQQYLQTFINQFRNHIYKPDTFSYDEDGKEIIYFILRPESYSHTFDTHKHEDENHNSLVILLFQEDRYGKIRQLTSSPDFNLNFQIIQTGTFGNELFERLYYSYSSNSSNDSEAQYRNNFQKRYMTAKNSRIINQVLDIYYPMEIIIDEDAYHAYKRIIRKRVNSLIIDSGFISGILCCSINKSQSKENVQDINETDINPDNSCKMDIIPMSGNIFVDTQLLIRQDFRYIIKLMFSNLYVVHIVNNYNFVEQYLLYHGYPAYLINDKQGKESYVTFFRNIMFILDNFIEKILLHIIIQNIHIESMMYDQLQMEPSFLLIQLKNMKYYNTIKYIVQEIIKTDSCESKYYEYISNSLDNCKINKYILDIEGGTILSILIEISDIESISKIKDFFGDKFYDRLFFSQSDIEKFILKLILTFVSNNRLDILKLIFDDLHLDQDININNISYGEHQTPLRRAIMYGRRDILDYLIYKFHYQLTEKDIKFALLYKKNELAKYLKDKYLS